MATLTASGVNCSDGTLNGQYTGTTVNYTSYPIGSFISRDYDTCTASPLLNQTLTPLWVNNTAYYAYYFNHGGAGTTSLPGTWRSRGFFGGYLLAQRVA